MATASREDVETSLMRELSGPEAAHVEGLLDRIERRIRARVPDLDERIDRGGVDYARLVRDVEAEAVARVFRNPEGYTSEGDGDYRYNINRLVASGLLTVTAEEWEALGVGEGMRMLAPDTDAYLASRRGRRPDLQFQWCWPARSIMSQEWEL